jgi:hypothetical protein
MQRSPQVIDTIPHLVGLLQRERVHLGTGMVRLIGEGEQAADLFDRGAGLSAAVDENQAPQVLAYRRCPPALRGGRRLPNFFIQQA